MHFRVETTVFDDFEHWTEEGYWISQEDGSHKHLTEITGEKVIDFLRACPAEQPFCLSVSFNAPHAQDGDPRQYIWPQAEDELYQAVTIPSPANADPAFFAVLPPFLQQNENRKRWHTRFNTPENYQRNVKGYWRMISAVDRMVGRFVTELERWGMADNTVIIFTSDHGFMIGERGYSDCWLLYEGSLRVPLVVCDLRPDAPAQGIVSDQLALNIDLSPTMLELAGLEVPPMVQGNSLVPLLRGENPAWRDDFFCEHLFNTPNIVIPPSEGVRSNKWKYIRYFTQDPLYEELFDLEADPDETQNMCQNPAYAKDLDRLRLRCDQLLAEARGA